jgi:NADH dehydrogenase
VATVFGGTGFLGRRIVEALRRRGWTVRVTARRPGGGGAGLEPVAADLRHAAAVATAVEGADAVVNAVSLYVEHETSFEAIHVAGAARLARIAAAAGMARVIHISGIGADPASGSPYIRARGRGEEAVRDVLPGAVVLRPCVMFGPGDAFLEPLAAILRSAPVLPLFGDGETLLQPVHVEDVAEAAARAATGKSEPLYELAGPDVVSYRTLVERLMQARGLKRTLISMPFPVWRAIAAAASLLPRPPVTEGQVALMRRDSIADPALPGLASLGIIPMSLDLDGQA